MDTFRRSSLRRIKRTNSHMDGAVLRRGDRRMEQRGEREQRVERLDKAEREAKEYRRQGRE